MSIRNDIGRTAQRVEQHLDALLTDAPHDPTELPAAMRYAALGGGKRIRPFLLIQAAALFGAPIERALDAACAIELLHCYSLVHDDLPAMDDDTLRRGRPTVHIAFNEATAILAGDALLTLAFEVMAGASDDPRIAAGLVSRLAKAAGWRGMAAGQALDLAAEGRRFPTDTIRRLQSLKTGALIAYACEGGAILGGAEPKERAALLTFGESIGLAFQVADDLLDVEGDAARVGKATGKDAAAGKATLVGALGAKSARDLLDGLERQAIEALAPFGARAGTLTEAARLLTRRDR